MEIVGVEGYLTDAEVFEVLNSEQYKKCLSLSEHDAKLRYINRTMGQLKKSQQAAIKSKSLSKKVTQEARKSTRQLEQLTQQSSKLLRLEGLTWVKEQTLKYLNTLPGSTQLPHHIEAFFRELRLLQEKYSFEFSLSEALALVNHRPTKPVEFQVLVEHFFERVESSEAQDAISTLCMTLPEPPAILEDDTNQDEIGDSIDPNATLDEETEELAYTEEQILAAQEDQELDINASHQIDHDIDMAIDDDD